MRDFMKILLFSFLIPSTTWTVIYIVQNDEKWFSRMALSIMILGFVVVIKELEARK